MARWRENQKIFRNESLEGVHNVLEAELMAREPRNFQE